MEKDRCEVFDSYGLPLHWYKPFHFVTWVFKHNQDVVPMLGNYKPQILVRVDTALRKLVTLNLVKLAREENQQSVLGVLRKL